MAWGGTGIRGPRKMGLVREEVLGKKTLGWDWEGRSR